MDSVSLVVNKMLQRAEVEKDFLCVDLDNSTPAAPTSGEINDLYTLDHGLSFNDEDLYLDLSCTGENVRYEIDDVPDLPVEMKEIGKKSGKKQSQKRDDISDEMKREMEILRMRHILDPKRHYKAGDWKKGIPKNAQLGTVIGDSADRYSNISRRSRPKSLVDELLKNERFRKRSKAQYLKIQKERARKHKNVSRHAKNKMRRR
ncbi:uncharacterized protein LOC135808128 [Sycon ciliatum]|uniref:uncharacterized protein LOC135808128 n=1 Tax=Sycon ciliatum TaxID=27933 RepID=UPI0020AD20D5|eukprot:scpid100574/ scgid27658/ Deoxynucleotidyltransferase terminal-interacting protein 2